MGLYRFWNIAESGILMYFFFKRFGEIILQVVLKGFNFKNVKRRNERWWWGFALVTTLRSARCFEMRRE